MNNKSIYLFEKKKYIYIFVFQNRRILGAKTGRSRQVRLFEEMTINNNFLVGKLFGFVDIDIECKKISVSANIGRLKLSTKWSESGISKTFLL